MDSLLIITNFTSKEKEIIIKKEYKYLSFESIVYFRLRRLEITTPTINIPNTAIGRSNPGVDAAG